MSDSLM
jgi:hypothetical protein